MRLPPSDSLKVVHLGRLKGAGRHPNQSEHDGFGHPQHPAEHLDGMRKTVLPKG
jgi:hypothetical protein